MVLAGKLRSLFLENLPFTKATGGWNVFVSVGMLLVRQVFLIG